MSVYVTSDLHGLPLERLLRLLEKANFCESDWLYILGDVIDRENDGGIEILKWLLNQPNAQLILGNHEAMLISCEFILADIIDDSLENINEKKRACSFNMQ